jgi:protein gp37
MGLNSEILWTDSSWNPWQGCHKVSPGCDNCYMYRDKKRSGQDPTLIQRSSLKTFNSPLQWTEPARVFVCSLSDFFIEEADLWRDEAWEIIRKTPYLTYQILTKRPKNIEERLPEDWGSGWPNVWLGVTAENQEMADKRIQILLTIPSVIRFVSVEPMLGLIDFSILSRPFDFHKSPFGWNEWLWKRINWVIGGGESGTNARSINPDWARSLRDQCKDARVPFFMKQMNNKGKIPEDLMIREFPIVK